MSLELFEAYIQEREQGMLLRHAQGFAILRLQKDVVYLQDVYVHPEHRQTGVATQLLLQAIDIAKKSNKKALITSTDVSTANPEQSIQAILSRGFKVLKLEENLIWYVMEI